MSFWRIKGSVMDRFVDERDFELLSGDKYTFFVLNRVLKNK